MLLQIDATIIFVFVSFVIFVFLMNLICYKPIMKVIEEREKLLVKNKQTVDETNLKKDNLTKEMNDEISKSKFESSKILKDTMDKNKLQKEESIKNKKENLLNSFIEFENEMNENSKKVKEELRNEIDSYVKSTVSKILNVSPDTVGVDREQIDEILK